MIAVITTRKTIIKKWFPLNIFREIHRYKVPVEIHDVSGKVTIELPRDIVLDSSDKMEIKFIVE